MRKLVAALLCAALLLPIIASPVAAAGEGPCENFSTYNDHVGMHLEPQGGFANVRGIRSQIFDQQDLDYCTGGNDANHGSLYWVALTPAPGNSQYGNTAAIIQIGVIRCQNIAFNVCTGTPRIFWAAGGCGIVSAPTPVDLGAAPIGGITFAVRRLSGGDHWLTAVNINGTLIAEKTLLYGNDQTECWATNNGPIGSQIFCERLDRGDNCGGAGGGNPINFQDIRYQVSIGGGWSVPGPDNTHGIYTDCRTGHIEHRCVDYSIGNKFDTYVIQQ